MHIYILQYISLPLYVCIIVYLATIIKYEYLRLHTFHNTRTQCSPVHCIFNSERTPACAKGTQRAQNIWMDAHINYSSTTNNGFERATLSFFHIHFPVVVCKELPFCASVQTVVFRVATTLKGFYSRQTVAQRPYPISCPRQIVLSLVEQVVSCLAGNHRLLLLENCTVWKGLSSVEITVKNLVYSLKRQASSNLNNSKYFVKFGKKCGLWLPTLRAPFEQIFRTATYSDSNPDGWATASVTIVMVSSMDEQWAPKYLCTLLFYCKQCSSNSSTCVSVCFKGFSLPSSTSPFVARHFLFDTIQFL